MTKEQKEIIFNFIKTLSIYTEGFCNKNLEKMPTFIDDISKPLLDTNKDNTVPALESKEALVLAIKTCDKCILHKERTNTVLGQGVENPKVLVIGEAPGEQEDIQGLPFVGPAGILLDKMLSSINLSRNTNCYIANIIKCRPPKNRTPEPNECIACFPYLQAQVRLLKPKAILTVGKVAAQTLLKTGETLSQIRGKLYTYLGLPLVVTYHPSALLRNESLKRPAWEDLKFFRDILVQKSII